MLRGVLRVECMVMRPLDALSTPLAAAKLLGITEALALVLTPADSLRTPVAVSIVPEEPQLSLQAVTVTKRHILH